MRIIKDLTGQRFDRLLVISRIPYSIDNHTAWLCTCDCGAEKKVYTTHLNNGKVKSCGCLPREYKDLTNQRFGRLIALYYEKISVDISPKWVCLCDCGKQVKASGNSLTRGFTKSCGCLRIDNNKHRSTTHGHTRNRKQSKVYQAWKSMITRCTNPNGVGWKNYGGRNISIDLRWINSFEEFYLDMGNPPDSSYSLERVNVNEGYSPSNCVWATRHEQARNTRQNRWITFNGETKCITDWAKLYGMNRSVLWSRLDSGWDIEKALTQPVKKQNRCQ